MGGRLAHFAEKWEEITDNKWVLSIVRNGFRIPFIKIPPLSSVPIRMSQSSSPFLREEIENLLNKRAVERVQNPETPGFYSRIFLVPKKNGKFRLILDLSLLNRYTEKQAFKMETVKSVRQAMRLNDWAVSIDLTDAYLHVPIHRQSRKYLRFVHEDQVYHFSALPFGMSLSPLIFSKLMDVIAAFLRQRAISVFPYLDDWLIKNLIHNRLITQTKICIQTIQSLGFLPNLKKSDLFPAQKFTFIGMEFLTQQNLVRVPAGSCTEPNSNNQENNVSKNMYRHELSFLFWAKLSAAADLVLLGRLYLRPSSDVPAVSLETSYSSSRSPDLDKRHDSISLTMVDKPHSIRDRDFNPSSRPQILPLYGCQSLRMGSSFGADNTVLSWSLDRKPIPAPYQYVRNDGHTISTETSQNIYSPFLHHDIHRQHNGGLIYQQTGWHSFPQSLRRSLENTQLVPGTRHSYQSTSHPRQIQHSCRPPLKTRQTYQDRMGSGSNSCEFSIPDAQLPKCGSVCDKIQPQTPIICLSSTRLQSTSDRCPVHGLESSSCICFSSFYSDTCCSRENPTTSVQNSSHSSVLATATVVLRTSSSISVSSDSSATNSKTTDSIQRKICTSKPPNSRPSRLGVIKQSIRDKKFSQNVADFVSRSRRASTQKVYDAKWTIFSNWCHTKKVNPISAPITVIADFLIFLFSEKKCQISTIKGYRSMISNTLKFKTGNRIGSNPVLSELIRSFELQRPVQRSLTPKWDLSWVLVCLQKPPFEPLDKASKFHVTIKTAFLLALATAKRCSEIHALAMDSQHLRFNQSDGSVSLILKSGFLAKNQLPSVKPDPIVVPSLARICKWEHTDRLLCPVRALKFYLKMTSSYRQNRTRLFLPIKGNKDISKDTISRWISYTVKLAYRKLTKRDISFLKIKAHEVRALSSSWAFFDKVPLNDILQAAVWNSSSTFAKFYLRDMSQQAQNLQSLGPIVVAQKVVGGQQQSAMDV